MQNSAIYPGTFDPFTNGHLDLVERGLRIFDRIIVGVTTNPAKRTLFSIGERIRLIEEVVAVHQGRVSVETFDGLLVDFARRKDVGAVIRGLRAVSDFEFELQMALMNRKMVNNLETVFLMPSLRYIFLSSTIVKEVASFGGPVDGLVPESIERALKQRYAENKKQ